MIVKKRMTVFILFFNAGSLAGVFSSIPKAHAFADRWNKAFPKSVEVMYLVERRVNEIDTMRKWENHRDDQDWVEVVKENKDEV